MADIFPGGEGTRAGGVKFPAPEHEGLFGLTRAQKLTILLGFFVALAAVVGQAMVLAVVTLAVAAVLAFLPVGEYRGCEWAAVAWTYARRRILGRTRDLPQLGEQSRGRGALRGYRFLSFESPLPVQGEIAVAVRRHRFTAVVECRGPSIALKDDGEVGAAYAAWGRFQRLAALASSRIARWSWTEIVGPSDPEAARQWFEQRRRVPAEHAAAASQRELLDDAGSSRQHRVLLAFQVDAEKASRQVKIAGGGDLGACTVLARALAWICPSLRSTAGLLETRIWTPDEMGAGLRTILDPFAAGVVAKLGGSARFGPEGSEDRPGSYFADGVHHVAGRILRLPELAVDETFLAPWLLAGEYPRVVTFLFTPGNPRLAVHASESRRITGETLEGLLQRLGFSLTHRRARKQQAREEHEAELGGGEAPYDVLGVVTVAGRTAEDADAAWDAVEQEAALARVELARRWLQQEATFAHCLPLAHL